MIDKTHIKQIAKLLNNENITKYELIQISFDIACVKLHLSNNTALIVKYFQKKNKTINAIKSESKNLSFFIKKKLNFFPKIITNNENYIVMEFIENDNIKPQETNNDLLESIIQIHSISNDSYGFDFNSQIGGIEQVNDYGNSWVNFYTNKRLLSIFEYANKKEHMGNFINEKITFILKNMNNFIPDNPTPLLLHGDLWEGNILFKKNKFVGFLDPGSFFGHNEMEVAYLRWFNPSFIDENFLDKYNSFISLEKNYQSYEPIYQLYYAICNVALWDRSFINHTKELLIKLKV